MNHDTNFNFGTWKPRVLVLGSGGAKGVSEIGAIYWFWLQGCLDDIDTFIGSSVGAIINCFIAMDMKPHRMLEYSMETTLFNDFSEIKWTQVMDEFGLVPNSSFDDALARQLKGIIIGRCGKMVNLKEFYEITKKRVIFTIVSLRYEKAYYIDHNSHPSLDLLEAMRMTSNSPLIFGKLEHQKDYMVDGAVIDPLPINHLDDGQTSILAIGVQDKKPFNIKKMGFFSYYDRIMSMPLSELTRYAVANASDQCYAVIVPVAEEMSMLDDGKNADIRMSMFLNAYRFTEEFTKKQPPHKPTKAQGQPHISKSSILTCLKTQSAKLILRAMKEEPQMFHDALLESGIDLNLFGDKRTVLDEPMPDGEEPWPEMPPPSKELIIVEEEEEEILELPRMFHQRDHVHTFDSFQQSFQPNIHGFAISIQLDEEFLEHIYQMCMNTVKMLGNDRNLSRLLQATETFAKLNAGEI